MADDETVDEIDPYHRFLGALLFGVDHSHSVPRRTNTEPTRLQAKQNMHHPPASENVRPRDDRGPTINRVHSVGTTVFGPEILLSQKRDSLSRALARARAPLARTNAARRSGGTYMLRRSAPRAASNNVCLLKDGHTVTPPFCFWRRAPAETTAFFFIKPLSSVGRRCAIASIGSSTCILLTSLIRVRFARSTQRMHNNALRTSYRRGRTWRPSTSKGRGRGPHPDLTGRITQSPWKLTIGRRRSAPPLLAPPLLRGPHRCPSGGCQGRPTRRRRRRRRHTGGRRPP